MSMTKKDYELIAAALNDVLWTAGTDPATVTSVVGALMWRLKLDNERFDVDRFMQAALRDPAFS